MPILEDAVGGDHGGCASCYGAVRLAGTRCKESSLKRRERRSRAEMRTYTRLVFAAHSTALHHTAEGLLVQVLRQFASMHNRQTRQMPMTAYIGSKVPDINRRGGGVPVLEPISPSEARVVEANVGQDRVHLRAHAHEHHTR